MGVNQTRIHTIFKKIARPARAKTHAEVQGAFERWETLLREFEPYGGKVPDVIRLRVVKQMVPEALEEDIGRYSKGFTSYSEVQQYFLNQAPQRREPFFNFGGDQLAAVSAEQKSTYAGDGERRSTCEQNHHDTFAVGNEFPGYCHTCGTWGHRTSNCPVKDKQMQAQREGWTKGFGKGGIKGYDVKGGGKAGKGGKGKGELYGRGNEWFVKGSGKGEKGKGKAWSSGHASGYGTFGRWTKGNYGQAFSL